MIPASRSRGLSSIPSWSSASLCFFLLLVQIVHRSWLLACQWPSLAPVPYPMAPHAPYPMAPHAPCSTLRAPTSRLPIHRQYTISSSLLFASDGADASGNQPFPNDGLAPRYRMAAHGRSLVPHILGPSPLSALPLHLVLHGHGRPRARARTEAKRYTRVVLLRMAWLDGWRASLPNPHGHLVSSRLRLVTPAPRCIKASHAGFRAPSIPSHPRPRRRTKPSPLGSATTNQQRGCQPREPHQRPKSFPKHHGIRPVPYPLPSHRPPAPAARPFSTQTPRTPLAPTPNSISACCRA